MAQPLNRTWIQHGRLTAQFFAADGVPGDWRSWQVSFATPFPDDAVRVVAMASEDGVDNGLGIVPVVPVVTAVTRQGFTLAARNSDVASGSAGMHWMAVRESPGTPALPPIDLRTVRVAPRWFEPDGTPGDWNSWPVRLGAPLPQPPTVLASAWRPAESHADAVELSGTLFSPGGRYRSAATPVGLSSGVQGGGFALSARNAAGWSGERALHGIALAAAAPGTASDPSIQVDSGTTGPLSITVRTGGNATVRREIDFALPFSTPPVVLFCASNTGLPAGTSPPAVAGWVESVTTHGFVLHAYNTDLTMGSVSFHWVAIGCGPACGAQSWRPSQPAAAPTPPIQVNLPPRLAAGQWLQASVVDKAGIEWRGPPVAWHSSRPEVARVDENGTVSGLEPGETLITATAGESSAQAVLKVDKR